ncbi:MAG TPA: S8 family serine peptidase, partial [Candidatus Polarisedimenticolia bacterium]|nr:S8 family serine peptidase [Candidatus Polarisedimenticolia bacterium]
MKKWRTVRRLGGVFTLLIALAGVGGVGMSTAPPASAARVDMASLVSDPLCSPMVLDALAASNPADLIPVIVTTAKPAGTSDESLARAKGATVNRRYVNLNGYAASVPASQLIELSRLPNITRVTYDDRIQVLNDINYSTVGADLVQQGYGVTGNGVTVAVLDSGIAPHPDIGSREVAEVEIVGHEQGFADYFGHGTHVAGIIAGNGSASSGSSSFRRFNGIAPQAKLVAVRVLGADGTGLVSDVLAGIDWIITNRSLYKIRVLNISLGHAIDQSYAQDPLCQAVERAWKAGIVVVVSAGNMGELGYGTVVSPGNDPYVITVGASNNYWSK